MKKMKLILEFSEFNLQRFNSDNTDVSIGLAPDNSLSVNAFDRHEDTIRQGMSRINTIMTSLSNSSAYRNLKSKLTFENQKPEHLKILRIVPNNVDYFVYITFQINDNEYDGVIKNILSTHPTFVSNVFQDNNLTQNEEWKIRVKGLIIESFKKFINIEPGKYKIINDKITCSNNNTGAQKILSKDDVIEVIKTIMPENKIIIKFNNDFYTLTKNNFIYFNYWFNKL